MPFKPLVIGHRGFSGLYPENTLLSISKAVEVGADIVECDLQLTKDEEIVLFHDPFLERIVKHENNKTIGDFTLIDLQTKDFGSWLDSKFSKVRITTLQEILDFQKTSKQKFDYILEVKDKNPTKLLLKMKNLLNKVEFAFSTGYISVRDEGTFHFAIENGFDKSYLALMQKKRSPSEVISIANANEIEIIQIRPKTWTSKDWDNLSHSGIKFSIFYADTEEEFKIYTQKKPYGLFSNFPNKLVKFYNDFDY